MVGAVVAGVVIALVAVVIFAIIFIILIRWRRPVTWFILYVYHPPQEKGEVSQRITNYEEEATTSSKETERSDRRRRKSGETGDD